MAKTLLTKEDQSYNCLKELILNGDLPHGKFLSQRMLAEKCKANIVTMRAALRQLENDGLIENVPQWGVRIPEETEEAIRDRYFLREILEIAAIRRIIERRNNIDVAELKKRAKECDELSSEPGENFKLFAERHYRFHQILTDMSGSIMLSQTYKRLWMRSLMLWNARRGWLRGFDRSPMLHQDLIQVILTESEKTAVDAIIEHIRHGLEIELNAQADNIQDNSIE